MSRAAELLGPTGPFARALPGYEAREGQLEMARAVERVLREDGVLLCEAGTGTGKTLAYLVPALLSGRKVIVSTATRALQEQIFSKDLPHLMQVLGLNVDVALMKGLSNYVCRRRLHELVRSPDSMRPRIARSLRMVNDWAKETESGDVSELPGIAEDDPLWPEVTASSDTRIGQNCAFHEECFVTRMRREAEQARLVVVNHHLFFADLALRGPHPGRVLPDYDAVIFDEAHQLEDVATDFFGVRVSSTRVLRLATDAQRTLAEAAVGDPLCSLDAAARVLDELRGAADVLWTALRAAVGLERDGRASLPTDAWSGEVQAAWHALDSQLEGVAGLLESQRGRVAGGNTASVKPGQLADALDVGARRAEELREQLATIAAGGPNRVGWLDAAGARTTVSSSPVELGGLLRTRLFDQVPAVVLTSATLSTSSKETNRFGYMRSRLGLNGLEPPVTEAVVPSPFDYPRRALLYTPDDLPEPSSPAFLDAATERVAELVALTGGGAFVLTTSIRALRAFESTLRAALPGHRLLVQGQAPKSTLLAAFRADGDAVLVATSSFWEGVDVPGRALRLVVLEKIPFPVPSDPIIEARSRALEAAGRNSFVDLQVPAAAIALKQGFGRLIRTRLDSGIVALLDGRVLRKPYGRALLATLPPARRLQRLADVQRAFAELARPPHAP